MPSKTASKPSDSRGSGNFVDDYLADWDQEDLFGSPSPGKGDKGQKKQPEKKKDDLGVDDELNLKRKARVPRVKLDETRLLSEKGIPKLRKMGPRIKFKGKGYEFDDAARLLSFYQAWLDDLFPKATFLDALAMVEKTGHKTTMRNARLKWIDESRPKTDVDDDIFDEDNRISTRPPQQAERVAPVFEKAEAAAAARERAKTPAGDGLFGEDIYNATPLRNPSNGATAAKPADDGVPDDDELDALMAEAEAQASTAPASNKPAQTAPSRSIFGGGPGGPVDDDDDDLEALIAEAEAQSAAPQTSRPAVSGSIFGDGKKAQSGAGAAQDEEDDLDAFMADVEAEAQASTNPASGTQATGTGGQKGGQTSGADDGDELDALMAEAEAAAAPSSTKKPATQASSGKGPRTDNYEDDEEALAEMGDIW